MSNDRPLLQDLTDILHIHRERTVAFNNGAYSCEHMLLKLTLHRELDNARDSRHSILRLLYQRFDEIKDADSVGQLYELWNNSKPSFKEPEFIDQLNSYEIADSITLQCYKMMLASPRLDDVSKSLLEFQYQNHLTIYESIKKFKTMSFLQHKIVSSNERFLMPLK